MTVGIVALFEIDNEEVYFVNTDIMNNNKIQEEYAEIIRDAIETDEVEISVTSEFLMSQGGYNALKSTIQELPCITDNYLIVRLG